MDCVLQNSSNRITPDPSALREGAEPPDYLTLAVYMSKGVTYVREDVVGISQACIYQTRYMQCAGNTGHRRTTHPYISLLNGTSI